MAKKRRAADKDEPAANKPLISVLIPTFNRSAMLATTLASLAEQSLPKEQYEVIIVDDGSTDATSEVCLNFASQIPLKYLRIENSGISAAKNRGILMARGEIVLFADDDDIADHRLLEEHLKAHDRHSDETVAILGYTTWAPTVEITPLLRYLTEIGRFLFAYGDLADGQVLDFRYFWGGRSSCKRSLLIKHGLFDPRFRTIIEDMELGYRLSRFGLSVIFHRAAVSYMVRELTAREFCERCERQGAALYLFSQLHRDPVVQQYCKIADPFIQGRYLKGNPESSWPEIAAAFREKLEQLGRIERLLAWGFQPGTAAAHDGSKAGAEAEAYRLQMHQLFQELQQSVLGMAELERRLTDQAESSRRQLGRLHAIREEAERRHATEQQNLREHYEGEELLLRSELASHRMEAEQLQDRFVQTNRILQDRSIALSEHEHRLVELTKRLRKQLWATRKLSHLLDEAENAAARLRSSRRWKLANPAAAIKSKLSRGKKPVGYGHLEKVVAAYSQWRASHQEMSSIDEELRSLALPGNTIPCVLPPGEPVPTGPPVPAIPIQSIRFQRHDDIEVSIIIPVFNQFQYTHACLASLQGIQQETRFEVIVVDDGSTDQTGSLVSQVENVVYLRNPSNSGFITSCNRGADEARGKYLVFLNNDTTVKAGWLTALLETFAEEPRAGIVGSKLIYPDGRLQEAGCITWRDASGWNYGKFDDPKKPEYNYLREVDYCSAAALMIPKSLFQHLGGFDARYAPAYYEDTDLSFKVRSEGHQVLYQPLAEVVHYEGVTGGTDVSTGAKKHQDINRSIFAERWVTELFEKPANGDLAAVQQAANRGKKILVIDHHLPMPDRDSGSLRMFQILKLLHQLGHRVTFIPDNLADIPPYTGELQKRGIEVQYYPYIKSVREYLESHGSTFDAVVLSRCDFARKHIVDVRLHAPQSRVIFDTVDLHFLREQREAELTGDLEARRRAKEKQQLEHELIDLADETWVVSCAEQKLLQEVRPDRSIQVVSNIVDVPGSVTPFALRRDWLFIGSFQHSPNVDAVLFFIEKIYPFVMERLSDAKFYVIGDKAPLELIAMAGENIIVTGLQSDVRPFFDSVRLSIAPLRYGAGVKGKINQSMAFGVPVVATSVAVEGMDLKDGEDVVVADEPMDFARSLIELYESEEQWTRISENAIQKTRQLYSADAARKTLRRLFSDEHIRSLDVPSTILRQTEGCHSLNTIALHTFGVSNTARTKVITGKITAKPNPVSFGQKGVLISWQTNDPAGAEVRVSTTPGDEKLVSQGKSGETEISWIVDSKVYDFRLYAVSQPDAPIDSVQVGKSAESVPIVLRDLADQVLQGNTAMEEVSRFVADVISEYLNVASFRELLPVALRQFALQVMKAQVDIAELSNLIATELTSCLDKTIKGKILATPNPVSLDDDQVVISWGTNDPAGGEVRVVASEGDEKLFSRAPSGEIKISWIGDSPAPNFCLYAAGQPDHPIASVAVRRNIESLPRVLRNLAAEIRRGNVDLANLSEFIADLVPIYGRKFREFFQIWERQGFHVTPVHFYQPIPNTQALPEVLWNRPSKLVGIDMNDEGQLNLVRKVFPKFRKEYEQLPQEPTEDPGSFYLNNGLFEGMDALVAYCMVRHFKPQLIIEVGSGFSSLVSGKAASKNKNSALICIEPFPEKFLRDGFPGLHSLIEKEVQQVDVEFFSQLGLGDILFIDSSHTVKIGGDVNYLFLEVLPRLKPGVIVHIHDIFLPFEYRRDWVMEEFRFWTEQYLLQAFLTYNSEFEVLCANSYLACHYKDDLRATFPTLSAWGGGSFWVRRKARSQLSTSGRRVMASYKSRPKTFTTKCHPQSKE